MQVHLNRLKALFSRRPWTGTAVCLLMLFVAFLFWPMNHASTNLDGITSTRILDRNGTLLREIRPTGRGIPVSLENINPIVLEAVVAIEDRHFYDHVGINPVSIFRALKDNMAAGAVVRGGSTLTMQLARARRANPERTVVNKMLEALLAIRLEVHLTKEEILESWLNTVYFGNQAYGIESAAQLYFGKTALDLNMAEAAMLVGLPQRPNAFNPYQHLEAAKSRQHRVLDALAEEDHLNKEEANRLKQISLDFQPVQSTFKAPHFVSFGAPNVSSDDRLATVQTTLDWILQDKIERLAVAHLKRLGNDRASNAAAVVLDNESRQIVAYMGSQDFWDASTGGQNDGVTMLRQPGSALKPFTYAIALASGKYTPATILPDIEIHVPEAGGAFSPLNYDKKFHGPVPLRTALASSYNVPAVRLLREFETASLIDVLHSAGITSLSKGPDHYGVGLTLGNGEVQLLELANAYATIANGGAHQSIQFFQFSTGVSGDSTYAADRPVKQSLIDNEVASLITNILQDPEARSPAFGRHGPLELPFPVAVKTGTSKDYRDNWAVGYTPKHTVAVWVGNFDGSPMRKVSGVSGAGPLFHSIMLALGTGGEFEVPSNITPAEVCPISGARPSRICPGSKKEIFLSHSVPTDTCTTHQHFNIDQRDGSLASSSTPAHFVTPTLFTVYPDEYAD